MAMTRKLEVEMVQNRHFISTFQMVSRGRSDMFATMVVRQGRIDDAAT